MKNSSIRFIFLVVHFLWPVTHAANDAPAPAAQNPTEAAWAAAANVMQQGPKTIQLRDLAKLELPDGYAFIPTKEAAHLMETMGNRVDDRFIGLVVPLSKANWFVTIDYEAAGYIKDDEAKSWDADELLDSIKRGTEAGNERRISMGLHALEVTHWVEPPSYDAATQRLVWSAEARIKDAPDSIPTINYNTYVLGREGYISLDLVTSSTTITTDKLAAKKLLAATEFNNGKRYSDYNASTDKLAAYGLGALIGGIAVKKLGLLAMIGVFFAKFAKVILLVVVAAGGTFAKFLKLRKESKSD